MLPVNVEKNTGINGYTAAKGSVLTHIERYAPFRVYDALKPAAFSTPIDSFCGQYAFYLCFETDVKSAAGDYTFSFCFRVKNEEVTIDVELRIYDVCVPVNTRLQISNWYNLNNIAVRHGVELWSEGFWLMFEKYASLMKRTRQTHFLLPFSAIKCIKSYKTIEFDFTNAELLIRLFFKLGFTTIEGGPLAKQLFIGDDRFMLLSDNSVYATSADGLEFQEKYYVALYKFLSMHNWQDNYVQHVADEPSDASAGDYTTLADNIRKWLPGIPLIDAICTKKTQNAPDIQVLDCKDFEENLELYRSRTVNRELWVYTCALPGGEYCNRLLDIPLIKTRLLHWGNAKYDLKGYLHWGFNCFIEKQDPFLNTSPLFTATRFESYLPPGDTHLVYPGNTEPYPSLRLEQMKSGIEDYELLKFLMGKDPEMAQQIIDMCFHSFNDVCSDEEFSNVYKTLLETLCKDI